MSGEQSGKEWDRSCSSSSSSSSSGGSTPVAAVRPFTIKPTMIHKAAINGYVDAVKELLDRGVDIEIRDSQGNSALHCAVEHNREKVVKFLLDEGASISLRGHLRNTPLHTAGYYGRENILKHMIEAGAPINVVNGNGLTPLMVACMKGHFECVKVLLDCKADFSKVDRWSRTPLMYAAQQSGMSQSGSEGELAFNSALEGNYLRIAKKLIEKGAKINSVDFQKRTALHFVALKGNVKMIRVLREAGTDHSLVDIEGKTPLVAAGFSGHEQAVYGILEFLQQGEVPMESMKMAAATGHVNFMKVLFEAFGRQAFYSCVPLYEASAGGHLECVQLLIQQGFNVNTWWLNDSQHLYPLQSAARAGKVGCLRELLKAGAKVDGRYRESEKTALHFAAENGPRECVEELLRAGAKHLLWDEKYPWQMAKTAEIQQLLRNHQNQQ